MEEMATCLSDSSALGERENNYKSTRSSAEQTSNNTGMSPLENAALLETENENHEDNTSNLPSMPENEEDESNNNTDREQGDIPETPSLISIQTNNLTEQMNIMDVPIAQEGISANDQVSETTNEKKVFLGDITSLLEDIENILECPVCLHHMVPPIILCESGHNTCFKCRPFMTKCPLCRGSFIKTRNVALEILARKMSLSCEDCQKDNSALVESESHSVSHQIQVTYTCPFTLYTHCYWQGNYSEIKSHMDEVHPSKVLTEGANSTWEMNLVVKDCKVIFALGEIFFYKERLDTTNSKFYIQVFYVGQNENHNQFSYRLEISSTSGQQRFVISNVTLPIDDLEHTYTYSHTHCMILDYNIVSGVSKHGDLKCTLSLERILRQ